MSRITPAEKANFTLFVRQSTNGQVIGIYQKKEKAAGRRTYAQVAKEEAIRRGIEGEL